MAAIYATSCPKRPCGCPISPDAAWSERAIDHNLGLALSLFNHLYKPIVDEWYHWHSNERGLRLGQHTGS